MIYQFSCINDLITMHWVGNLIDSIAYRQTYIRELLVNDGGGGDEPPLDC